MKKHCPGCQLVKPLSDFYRTARQVLTLCKRCHNSRCTTRVRTSSVRRAQQSRAKRAWSRANPVRKAIHEGRTVFLHQPSAPAALCQLELLILDLARITS